MEVLPQCQTLLFRTQERPPSFLGGHGGDGEFLASYEAEIRNPALF